MSYAHAKVFDKREKGSGARQVNEQREAKGTRGNLSGQEKNIIHSAEVT